jgi:LuxR family maltose regulon positive regulatory protein
MPKAAMYAVKWVPQQNKYVLFRQDIPDPVVAPGDDPAWFAWLAEHTSFSFQGKQGRLTLLKEERARGAEGYWYAYRRQGKGKLKHYLGRDAHLTMDSLESAAQALQASPDQEQPAPDTSFHRQAPAVPRQQSPFLMPKLLPPRLPSSLVERQRLLARLDSGLERKFTLLVAPAGFGKTTLVRQWIGERRNAGADNSQVHQLPPVAWVALDPEDDDPVRFWRYVLTACQTLPAGVGQAALTQLAEDRTPFALSSLKAVLTTFLNEAAQSLGRIVLVLEDYHVITASQIHEALTFVLDHLPATLHVVIMARNEPPLPLARWRARDDLLEIHAADLRFSREEMALFLQQALPFLSSALSTEVVERLDTELEGWVTGLRLFTLTLGDRQQPQEIERALAGFTGSHRYLLDYFVSEVLAPLPETLQTFLLQTSILGRMTAPLCDAVTMRDDSARLLEEVERAGFFLQSLDGAESWYRYHALFAEAMQAETRRRLGEEALHACLMRASSWYRRHGMLAEAIEATLQAGAWTRAATLMEQYIQTQYSTQRHELVTLLRWLEHLPETALETHPMLCVAYATALLFILDRSAPATMALMQVPLTLAERAFRAQGNDAQLGAVLTIRAQAAWWQGDLRQVFTVARQAQALLSEQDLLWRASNTLSMGIEQLLAGQPDKAQAMILEAQTLFSTIDNGFGVNAAISQLGEVYAQQGDLRQSEQCYQQLLTESREDLLDRADALFGLARLSYEWNDLQTAGQHLREVLDLGRHLAEELGKYHVEAVLVIPATLVLARVLHARGDSMQARRLLQQMVILSRERGWTYLHREALATLARIDMADGDLDAVQQWQEICIRLGEDFRIVQQEREALIIARLLIAQGAARAALPLLESWLEEAQAHRRRRSELEIRIVLARAHAALASMPQARQTLKEALMLAQAKGYQRLFLDEGEALRPLLRAALHELREEPLVSYARGLLHGQASSQTEQDTAPHTDPALLLEPLSSQELRVLRLLSAGRSNPEIAETLIVSINTVKTQVQSIYRKLNVRSRWEAREAASRLNLL